MNKQNFNQLGGFPLETDTLDWLQEAYSIFNALGDVIGNYAIISGCTVNGSNVGDGVVFINGEVYKFVGGAIQANVRIIQTSTTKVFENGDINPVHNQRYVTFASGVGEISWSNFKRPETLINLSSRILPPGSNPQMYTGNPLDLPEGWNLCDGGTYNNILTPDLRKRFIVGWQSGDADYGLMGGIGGADKVTLTESEMPSHTHSGSTNSAGSHTHIMKIRTDEVGSGNGAALTNSGNSDESLVNYNTESAGAHTHTMNLNSTGGDEAHENRPPYYVLAYIIYTGI